MDDTVKFLILIVIGAIGVFFAFSLVFPEIRTAFGSGTESSLFANVSSVVGPVSTDNSAAHNKADSVFYASYDNLQNIHPVRLQNAAGARITSVCATNNFQSIFIGTTKGLFVSDDGGLNYTRKDILGTDASMREPAYLSSSTIILDILPANNSNPRVRTEKFYISTYNGSEGGVYKTENSFSTLDKVVDFKKEAAYAMYVLGSDLYFGMSNGQLLRYNMNEKLLETLSEFPKQITKIVYAPDGFYYLMLENGALYRAASPYATFTKIRIPGGGFFSGASAKQFVYDNHGNIYIRTSDGIYRSTNSGATFEQYDKIPLLAGTIDTFGVSEGNIHILSGGRLFTSSDEGDEWKVKEVPYARPIWESYFIDGGRVILTR